MNPSLAESELEAIASDWIARRDRGLTPAQETELAGWLRDPAHAAAFARCEALWRDLPRLKALPPRQLDALMTRRRRRLRLAAWFAGAAAAAALILLVFTPEAAPPDTGPVVRTHAAPGNAEARVALPDGSVAVLQRGARIAWGDFSTGRQVRLLQGEAHFTVAEAASRPFVVRAGTVTIRDLGTAFNVRLEPDRVAVLVTAGSVAVAGREAGTRDLAPATGVAAAELVLTAGQQAVVATATPEVTVSLPTAGEREQVLAWKSRRLTFDRTSLAAAVELLNRYNVRQLRLADPRLESVLIAGGVQADNLDAFVALLESGFGIVAEADGNELRLREAR